LYTDSFNKREQKILDLFEELGMPPKLAKTLLKLSEIEGVDGYGEVSPIDDVDGEKDRYDIVVYETVYYPPGSIPPGQKN